MEIDSILEKQREVFRARAARFGTDYQEPSPLKVVTDTTFLVDSEWDVQSQGFLNINLGNLSYDGENTAIVWVTPPERRGRCTFSLTSKAAGEPKGRDGLDFDAKEVFYHLSMANFKKIQILQNTKQTGWWDKNFLTQSSFPVPRGQMFELRFVLTPSHVGVYVDGQLFSKYPHRLPLPDGAPLLLVCTGDVVVHRAWWGAGDAASVDAAAFTAASDLKQHGLLVPPPPADGDATGTAAAAAPLLLDLSSEEGRAKARARAERFGLMTEAAKAARAERQAEMARRAERAKRFGTLLNVPGPTFDPTFGAASAAAAAAASAADADTPCDAVDIDAIGGGGDGDGDGGDDGGMHMEPRVAAREVEASAVRRPHVLYVHGVDCLSSDEVRAYFAPYAPCHVTWLGHSSCLAEFADAASAQRAMVGCAFRAEDGVPDLPAGVDLSTAWCWGKALRKGSGDKYGQQGAVSSSIRMRVATELDVREFDPAKRKKRKQQRKPSVRGRQRYRGRGGISAVASTSRANSRKQRRRLRGTGAGGKQPKIGGGVFSAAAAAAASTAVAIPAAAADVDTEIRSFLEGDGAEGGGGVKGAPPAAADDDAAAAAAPTKPAAIGVFGASNALAAAPPLG